MTKPFKNLVNEMSPSRQQKVKDLTEQLEEIPIKKLPRKELETLLLFYQKSAKLQDDAMQLVLKSVEEAKTALRKGYNDLNTELY